MACILKLNGVYTQVKRCVYSSKIGVYIISKIGVYISKMVCRFIRSELGHCLWFLKSLNDNEIKSCNQEPMAYIVPFLHRFQAYFSSHKH
jgi:hypothetical protein